jgi:hypothetical protein
VAIGASPDSARGKGASPSALFLLHLNQVNVVDLIHCECSRNQGVTQQSTVIVIRDPNDTRPEVGIVLITIVEDVLSPFTRPARCDKVDWFVKTRKGSILR